MSVFIGICEGCLLLSTSFTLLCACVWILSKVSCGMSHDIADWQRRLRAGPKVWMVVDRDQQPTNYYESQEAAEIEIAWRKRHGDRGYRLQYAEIHSMQLSDERWNYDISQRGEAGGGG